MQQSFPRSKKFIEAYENTWTIETPVHCLRQTLQDIVRKLSIFTTPIRKQNLIFPFNFSEAVARHIKIHAKPLASDCKDDLGNDVQENFNQELQSKGRPANVEKDQGVSKKRSR